VGASLAGLGEAGPDNLGLACTDDGLLLGRTPLIERRDGRFVVRERDDIERSGVDRVEDNSAGDS